MASIHSVMHGFWAPSDMVRILSSMSRTLGRETGKRWPSRRKQSRLLQPPSIHLNLDSPDSRQAWPIFTRHVPSSRRSAADSSFRPHQAAHLEPRPSTPPVQRPQIRLTVTHPPPNPTHKVLSIPILPLLLPPQHLLALSRYRISTLYRDISPSHPVGDRDGKGRYRDSFSEGFFRQGDFESVGTYLAR